VNYATSGQSQSIVKRARNLNALTVGTVKKPNYARKKEKKVSDLLTEIEDLARLILSYDMGQQSNEGEAQNEKAI
jgi:tRNA G37 N-methylase TrmD